MRMPVKPSRVAPLLVPLLALVMATRCTLDGSSRPVVLGISRVVLPSELAPGVALHVTVTVNTGGCLTFDHLQVDRTPSRVTITARGFDRSGPGIACPTYLGMQDVSTDVAPPFTDPLAVDAMQNDGTVLESIVRIR